MKLNSSELQVTPLALLSPLTLITLAARGLDCDQLLLFYFVELPGYVAAFVSESASAVPAGEAMLPLPLSLH